MISPETCLSQLRTFFKHIKQARFFLLKIAHLTQSLHSKNVFSSGWSSPELTSETSMKQEMRKQAADWRFYTKIECYSSVFLKSRSSIFKTNGPFLIDLEAKSYRWGICHNLQAFFKKFYFQGLTEKLPMTATAISIQINTLDYSAVGDIKHILNFKSM